MDFSLRPELASLREEVRAFVDERILPAERAVLLEDRDGRDDTLLQLQDAARAEGLWTPHLPEDLGGRNLGPMGMAVAFREMGRSPVGARVFHCDAPDQGNMDLLVRAGSPEMKERWLAPLCRGEITSGFGMTEPAPGAGADPTNLRTRAVRDEKRGGWRITGRKWYTTGGDAAAFLLVMARTSEDRRTGATLFLVPRDAEGLEHVREIPTMAEPILTHREAEMTYEDVFVPDANVIGGVGQGFILAQVRLVPARLTHCMRWLGLASRALEETRRYVGERMSFGRPLADHQLVQQKLADGAMRLHSGNLMTMHCAWLLEQGRLREARSYSSMCKHHVANALCDVLDDCIQLHGGLGFSEDLPYSTWYRHARAARIADGPDEVHVMVVARDFLKERFELLV